MNMEKITSSAAFADSKPHYEILDGLRGVAALMVIMYHVLEVFPLSFTSRQFSHGHLAVDFFFILSGFVIGYAYDDRWGRMTVGNFFKRRLIRLHPMVLMGIVLGVVFFAIQGCVQWDGTHVATSAIMLAVLLTMFMIPAAPGSPAEIRGNAEMFPVNGPYWSLFFEYIGNILYALFIRRLPRRALGVLALVLGVLLAVYSLRDFEQYGNLGFGWSMLGTNFWGGLLRMGFSYTLGMWLARGFRPRRVRGAFWWCTLILVVLMSMPALGVGEDSWRNNAYELFCVCLVFPLVVLMGASGTITDRGSRRLCKFMGDISYPLYVVHYPSFYLYYAWVLHFPDVDRTFAQTWPWGVVLIVGNILLAWACLKWYDEPLRRFLSRRWLSR